MTTIFNGNVAKQIRRKTLTARKKALITGITGQDGSYLALKGLKKTIDWYLSSLTHE